MTEDTNKKTKRGVLILTILIGLPLTGAIVFIVGKLNAPYLKKGDLTPNFTLMVSGNNLLYFREIQNTRCGLLFISFKCVHCKFLLKKLEKILEKHSEDIIQGRLFVICIDNYKTWQFNKTKLPFPGTIYFDHLKVFRKIFGYYYVPCFIVIGADHIIELVDFGSDISPMDLEGIFFDL